MEFTSAELAEAAQTTPDLPIWRLSVDGATNAQGSGAGLILTSPEGIDIEYALRFGSEPPITRPSMRPSSLGLTSPI